MRSLTSPKTRLSSGSPVPESVSAAKPPNLTAESTSPLMSPIPAELNVFEPPNTPTTVSSQQTLDPTQQLLTSTPTTISVIAENNKLKNEILELSERYKCVLDHSIESDMRLIQYTEQVFVPNMLPMEAEATPNDPPSIVADCAIQCELAAGPCQDPQCAQTRELVTCLRTTIEVLEAEILSLKGEALAAKKHQFEIEREQGQERDSWTINRNHPIKLKNKFDTLNTLENNKVNNIKGSLTKKSTNQPRHSNKTKATKKMENPVVCKSPKAYKSTSKCSVQKQLQCKQILIEGDSHARHLARIMQQRVSSNTVVTGICKPGAKLADVVSSACPPASGSCCILIAGSNDVATGNPHSIYRDLEKSITKRNDTAEVMVVTLPHRHDLHPQHPVNLQIAQVNTYILELGERLSVKVVDVNSIRRRMFTRHGMHMRLPGKRLLVELLLRGLSAAEQVGCTETSRISSMSPTCPPTDSAPSPTQPRTLQYDSFAEAVKQPSASNPTNSSKDIFLTGRLPNLSQD